MIDPHAFSWTDDAWPGSRLEGQVIYEMHIGTFTPEGTWTAAERQLAELASLGVTTLELMPVADFPGRFGWGYDGVNLFAPTRLYGTPDEFRSFVDSAHALGLAVILDVVYNHLGPDYNFLKEFSTGYFTDRYQNEWGEAVNFDGENSGPVREFFIANASYWIREFHLDGLRLDATQTIFDRSSPSILEVIPQEVRKSAGSRSTLVIGENESQQVRLVQPKEQGGYGIDALWNDDFHHSAMVALTGFNEAYYTDYLGTPQELISAIKWGFLYQGQYYSWQQQPRGTPAYELNAATFINYIQNHDQIANAPRSERCHALTSPGRYRAMTALMLLGPGTPMLFQGQEFSASSPFYYFADHRPELSQKVREGREKFLAQFLSMSEPDRRQNVPAPSDPEAFKRSKLDFSERESHSQIYALHRDLLRLRREDLVFRSQQADRLHGAVLGDEAFALRYFGAAGDDRLLLVNLGRDLHLVPAPEPLLAPPAGARWEILWSSEDPRYGGSKAASIEVWENWRIPGRAAVVLNPRKDSHGS